MAELLGGAVVSELLKRVLGAVKTYKDSKRTLDDLHERLERLQKIINGYTFDKSAGQGARHWFNDLHRVLTTAQDLVLDSQGNIKRMLNAAEIERINSKISDLLNEAMLALLPSLGRIAAHGQQRGRITNQESRGRDPEEGSKRFVGRSRRIYGGIGHGSTPSNGGSSGFSSSNRGHGSSSIRGGFGSSSTSNQGGDGSSSSNRSGGGHSSSNRSGGGHSSSNRGGGESSSWNRGGESSSSTRGGGGSSSSVSRGNGDATRGRGTTQERGNDRKAQRGGTVQRGSAGRYRNTTNGGTSKSGMNRGSYDDTSKEMLSSLDGMIAWLN